MPSNLPVFASSAFHLQGVASTACSSGWASPTNMTILGSAGTGGALITNLWCLPRATNTALMAMVFCSASGGSGAVMMEAKGVSADTVSITDPPTKTTFAPTESAPWRLLPGDILLIGISVAIADGMAFHADGAHF